MKRLKFKSEACVNYEPVRLQIAGKQVAIHRGTPTDQDIADIAELLSKGFYMGFATPRGITWNVQDA